MQKLIIRIIQIILWIMTMVEMEIARILRRNVYGLDTVVHLI